MNTSFRLDFIGIGAPKAGTTWLSDMLAAHPQICMARPKEVRYFNRLVPIEERHWQNSSVARRMYPRPVEGVIQNPDHLRPLSWYARHFRCDRGRKVGEFTPSYLRDRAAPAAIHRCFPDVKLVACLRNPIDRAYSEYGTVCHYLQAEPLSFDEAVRMQDSSYVDAGRYYRHLKRYLQYFDRRQLLVLVFEDILERPAQVLAELYAFLGVDPSFVPGGAQRKSNPARQVRWRSVPHLLERVPRALVRWRLGFVLGALKAARVDRLFHWIATYPPVVPSLEPATREYLRDVFRDEIRALEELLDRDLSRWVSGSPVVSPGSG